jgi:hypothetical protein
MSATPIGDVLAGVMTEPTRGGKYLGPCLHWRDAAALWAILTP